MTGAYWGQFRISMREQFHYFFSDSFWAGAISVLFTGVILLLYQASGKTLFFGTFSWTMLAWYLISAQFITHARGLTVDAVSDSVQNGEITSMLSKPFSLPFAFLANHLGESFVAAISVSLFLIPFGLIVTSGAFPGVLSFAAFLVLAFLALLLDFWLSFSIGLLAFWTEDAKPFAWIYGKVLFVIGGLFFPLELFPSWIGKIVTLLPPSFLVYHPAKVFVSFSWSSFAFAFAGLLVYVTLAMGLAWFVFRRAVRKVNLNGG